MKKKNNNKKNHEFYYYINISCGEITAIYLFLNYILNKLINFNFVFV